MIKSRIFYSSSSLVGWLCSLSLEKIGLAAAAACELAGAAARASQIFVVQNSEHYFEELNFLALEFLQPIWSNEKHSRATSIMTSKKILFTLFLLYSCTHT